MKYVSRGNFEIIDFDDIRLVVPNEKCDGGFIINESSEFVLSHLETPQDIDTLVEQLMKRYDVSKEKANDDIVKFIEMMQENLLIEAVE